MKAFYIGAGLHFEPLHHFPFIKEFVFVDTLPRSEFDARNQFNPMFYHYDFIPKLVEECQTRGFLPLCPPQELDPHYFTHILSLKQRALWFSRVKILFPHICPTRFTFYNSVTKQTLKYYVSTNIETNLFSTTLCNDIASCTIWIVCGHWPCIDHINSANNLKLIVYTSTCLSTDNIKNAKISQYYLCDHITGEMEECATADDLITRSKNRWRQRRQQQRQQQQQEQEH